MCEFDQKENSFSIYFDDITSSKLVKNNIPEGYKQEKYPGYASRNSFLKFISCVAAEQNNNNENSDPS